MGASLLRVAYPALETATMHMKMVARFSLLYLWPSQKFCQVGRPLVMYPAVHTRVLYICLLDRSNDILNHQFTESVKNGHLIQSMQFR